MKRFISLLLTCILLLGAVPAQAVGSTDSELQAMDFYGNTIYYKETDTRVTILVPNPDGTATATWAYRDAPYTVYEKVLPKSNGISMNTPLASISEFEPNVRVISFPASHVVHGNSSGPQMAKNAITNMLKDIYGSPYSWKQIAINNSHSPVILRVREKMLFQIEYAGLSNIPSGVTIASAATTLAARILGITVPGALSTIMGVLGIYDSAATITQDLTVETYEAKTVYQRWGTAQANQSAQELMYDRATAYKYSTRYYSVDKTLIDGGATDYMDVLHCSGTVGTEYSPSENGFLTTTLMNNAYAGYFAGES